MIITPFNVCKFKFIGLFNHIIWLQYIQEQSRQTLLPGLKLSYDHPHFWAAALLCSLFAELHDHIGTGVHAERAAVEADVIILCLPPDAARVVLIIDLALLVLLGETLLR